MHQSKFQLRDHKRTVKIALCAMSPIESTQTTRHYRARATERTVFRIVLLWTNKKFPLRTSVTLVSIALNRKAVRLSIEPFGLCRLDHAMSFAEKKVKKDDQVFIGLLSRRLRTHYRLMSTDLYHRQSTHCIMWPRIFGKESPLSSDLASRFKGLVAWL